MFFCLACQLDGQLVWLSKTFIKCKMLLSITTVQLPVKIGKDIHGPQRTVLHEIETLTLTLWWTTKFLACKTSNRNVNWWMDFHYISSPTFMVPIGRILHSLPNPWPFTQLHHTKARQIYRIISQYDDIRFLLVPNIGIGISPKNPLSFWLYKQHVKI